MATRKTTTATAEPTPTPQTETTPTPEATQTDAIYKGVITSVQASKAYANRISITTNVSFESFDESGNKCTTNRFGRAKYSLLQELQALAPNSLLAMAVTATMGLPMADSAVGMLLQGASISFSRTLKRAGELREDEEQTPYENDTYVTHITKFAPANNPLVTNIILSMITSGTIGVKEQATANVPSWSFE